MADIVIGDFYLMGKVTEGYEEQLRGLANLCLDSARRHTEENRKANR